MIDPKAFVVANERGLHKGQRVRTRHGPGKIELIWFGQEENAVVTLDDGTQRDCGLEMDDVWPETKETKMRNLEQDYDAVERKGEIKPRAIRRRDVLRGITGKHYLLAWRSGRANLVGIFDGRCLTEPIAVENPRQLTRDEASRVCSGGLHNFRLVGRASDVLTLNDPGE